MAVSVVAAFAQAQLEAAKARLNGGMMRIYAPATPGGAVPADVDAPLGGAILLAEMPLANPAFGAVTESGINLVCATPAATSDSGANATGLAVFFRLFNDSGELQLHGTAGDTESDADMLMAQPNIVEGGPVDVSSIILQLPRK